MGLERPDPQVIVIFGASGDLTKRKAIPALYNLYRENLLPANFAVVGFARTPMTKEEFRDQHARGRLPGTAGPASPSATGDRSRSTSTTSPEATGTRSAGSSSESSSRRSTTSTAPRAAASTTAQRPRRHFPEITHCIGEMDMADQARIVVEKPFGYDEQTADDLNSVLHGVSSRNSRSSGSTITSARRPSRTSWSSGSPTACSSRSGTAAT